jgi:hypothetical protein
LVQGKFIDAIISVSRGNRPALAGMAKSNKRVTMLAMLVVVALAIISLL